MTMRLIWSAAARDDLRDITSYIANRDAAMARTLADRIQVCVQSLADHPYDYPMGRISGTREALVHPNYALTYQAGEDTVEIVSMLHTRRQFPPAG